VATNANLALFFLLGAAIGTILVGQAVGAKD